MRKQAEPSDEALNQRHLELGRAARRSVRFSVLLPFALLLVLLVAIVVAVMSLRSPAQVALLSDSMLTVLVLCPLVICMFPLVILSLVLAPLLNRWHPKSRSPLRRLEAWTAGLEHNVEGWLGNVDERVLNWAVKLAPLRELLTAFDLPAAESSDEGIE